MFTTPGLQKYIDGSTVLNTKKFGILPGLVDPDVLQSIQAFTGSGKYNGQYQCTRWDKRPEFNALGQYKDVPQGTFLINAYNPNVTNKSHRKQKTELALPIAMEFRVPST
jgi:hypothetical protein